MTTGDIIKSIRFDKETAEKNTKNGGRSRKKLRRTGKIHSK